MNKVYCKNCKFFRFHRMDECNPIVGGELSSFLSPKLLSVRRKFVPSVQNKNNSCGWYRWGFWNFLIGGGKLKK